MYMKSTALNPKPLCTEKQVIDNVIGEKSQTTAPAGDVFGAVELPVEAGGGEEVPFWLPMVVVKVTKVPSQLQCSLNEEIAPMPNRAWPT